MTDPHRTSPGAGGTGEQSPFLRTLGGIPTLLDWSGRIIAAASLGILFLTLLANVILRYAFGTGIAWAYEIHALLLPWLVGAGIVIASARHRNIAIALLPDRLGPSGQRILLLIIQAVIVLIALSVLWSSQPILRASKFQNLSTLGIKQIWGYASLVYAFACMAIISAVDFLRVLGGIDVIDHNPEHASLS
jgi:TRAP-type transport system small permease protein